MAPPCAIQCAHIVSHQHLCMSVMLLLSFAHPFQSFRTDCILLCSFAIPSGVAHRTHIHNHLTHTHTYTHSSFIIHLYSDFTNTRTANKTLATALARDKKTPVPLLCSSRFSSGRAMSKLWSLGKENAYQLAKHFHKCTTRKLHIIAQYKFV